jgi:enoyl-CoA hydratase
VREVKYNTILYEKDDGVATITLNRPDRLNAINAEMDSELTHVVDEIAGDSAVRVVVITGNGRAFSSGADIKEIVTSPESSFGAGLSRGEPLQLFIKIDNLNKPVIAAINGLAIGGGCELAMVCDLRIASSEASFGFGEIMIGMIPSAGGTVRLPRLINAAKARELLFMGEPIDANEAFRIGLINKVVALGTALQEAKGWASKLCLRAPLGLRAIKSCFKNSALLPMAAAVEYEAKEAAVLVHSRDRQEGMRAFVEKRLPSFEGK